MKKSLVLLFILSLFIFTSCSNKEENIEINKYYEIEKVSTGSISLNNSYVSYAQGQKEIPVATKAPGRINYIPKEVGDKVKVGELIASVGTYEAQSALETANSIINSLQKLKASTAKTFDDQIKAAMTNYNQIKLGSELIGVGISGASKGVEITKETIKKQLETVAGKIKQAEAGVKQAEAGVKQAEAGVKVAQSQYETAKTALDRLTNVLDGKEKIIYENSNDAITNSVILYTNILDFADQLLSVTKDNKDSNKKFRDYLSAKNKKYLAQAKYNFITTNNLFEEYKRLYHTKIENGIATKQDLKEILQKGKKIALSIKILLKNLYNVVDSSIDNVYFPLAKINNLKSEISGMGNKVEQSLITIDSGIMLGLKGSLQSIDSFDREKSMQISLAIKKLQTAKEGLEASKKQVELAKASYNAALAGLETAKKVYEQYKEMGTGKVVEMETKRDSAKKNQQLTLDKKNELTKKIESIKAMKDAKLKEIDAKIAEAIGQKKQAEIMSKNGKVYSPVNGIVTQKMAEIGQVVGAGMPIYMISDNSKIKLKVGVPDEILKNIKVGTKVIIEFESSKSKYVGKITSIPNSKNRFTKKTPIEIIVDNKSGKIKVGDLAKVYFPSAKKNGILISNSAIIEKYMLPGVYVVENKTVKFRKINIISSSSTMSEVTGVKPGEIIITKGKENLYDGEKLK